MALTPPLRPPEDFSADAERLAVLRRAAPVRTAALTAVLASVFLVVGGLVGLGRIDAGVPFLESALGPEKAGAPLSRTPAPGVDVRINPGGYTVTRGGASVSVTSEDIGGSTWRRHLHGVTRETEFGAVTIVVDGTKTEEYLTVTSRQGERTWRWKLATRLVPRLGRDGGVGFLDPTRHVVTPLVLDPVRILGGDGKDVTPEGLGWGLEQDDEGWWLLLELDDAELPLPYVIDPAVSHRLSATAIQASGTSLVLSVPAGVQENDLLVAHVARGGNAAFTAPAGWTAAGGTNNGNFLRQATYHRIAGPSEPATYTWTWSGNQSAAGGMSAYYGAKATDPVDLVGGTSSGNSGTVTAPGLTTTTADALVVAFFSSNTNSTYSTAAGMTERYERGTAGAASAAADDMTQASPGGTGNKTSTLSASGRWVGHQVAFKVDDVDPLVAQNDPGTPLAGTILLEGAASDADSAVAGVQFQRSPAGAGTWTNVGAADLTSPYSVSFDTTSVVDGLYDFRAVATDIAGNVASSTAVTNRRIDNTEPSSTTTFPAASGAYNAAGWDAGCSSAGLCGTHSDTGSGVATVELSLRQGSGNYWSGGSFSSGSEVWHAATLAGGNWSYGFAAGSFPADGDYTVRVRAIDNAANVQTPATRTFTIDTTPPPTTIDSTPADPTASTAASFDFSSSEGGSTFECRLDGGSWGACTSPRNYGSLTDDSHTFEVRATDAVGNTDPTPASFTWLVDTTAPSSTPDFPADAGVYGATAWSAGCATDGLCGTYSDGSGSGVSAVELSIRQGSGDYWNGGAFGSASEVWVAASLGGGSWSYAFPAATFSADGDYTVRVRARDAVLNEEAPSGLTFTYDTTNPSAALAFPASGGAYADGGWDAGCDDPGFCGTAADGAGAGVADVEISIRRAATDLYWDGAAFAAGTEAFHAAAFSGGVWDYALDAADFPADGLYTVHVRARDLAGNMESGPSRTFLIDNVAPSSAVGFPAAAGVYNAAGWAAGCDDPGLCGTASDSGSGVAAVEVSIRQGTDDYWDGAAFASTSEAWHAADLAAGDWTYALAAGDFPADGDYTVRARAADAAGIVESPSSRTFTIDRTAPQTAIDTAPADPAAVDSADFEFSADEGGSSFQCRLDADPWTPCTSPTSHAGLSDTSHTFQVRATDPAGNTDPTPASFTWLIDTTPPTPTYDFPAAADVYNAAAWDTGCDDPGLCGTTTDGIGSGTDTVEISIRHGSGDYWDGNAFTSATEAWHPADLDADDWAYHLDASDFPTDGDYTIRLRATDTAGNTNTPTSRTLTYDNTDPTSTVAFPDADGNYNTTGWTAGCPTAGLCGTHADATSGTAAVEISLRRVSTGLYWDGAGFASGSETFLATSLAGGDWSYAFPAGSFPADGEYELRLRATDEAGNVETASGLLFRIDNANPSSAFGFPAAGGTYSGAGWDAGCDDPGLCGTAADTGSGIAQIQISLKHVTSDLYWDGDDFDSPTETFFTADHAAGDWHWDFLVADHPADGLYTAHIRATDRAGNTEPGPTRTYTIDTVAPDTTISSGPPAQTASSSASFEFDTTEGGSTFQCRVDGDAWTPCTSPADYEDVEDGAHTFEVRAIDAAGNVDPTPASRDWTVDATAPSSTISFPATAAVLNAAAWDGGCGTIGLCGDYADATSGVQKVEVSFRRDSTGLYWNGAAFSAGSEQLHTATLSGGDWSYPFPASSFPADGDYTIRVHATDEVGNAETPTSRTFAFDATAPTGSLTAPADGAAVRGETVAVSSDSADSGSGVASAEFQHRLDGQGAWTSIGTDTTAPYSVDWDTTEVADGDYELRVLTADEAGNTTASAARTVTVDNTAPGSATLDPLPGAIRNGQALTGTGTDAGSGVDSVEYVYCEGSSCSPSTPIGSSSTGPGYEVAWTGQPADGDVRVLARVTDRAGNTLDSALQTVVVDNTDPAGSITAPDEDAVVSGTVAVSSDSADSGSGVASAQFQRRPAGGGAWTTIDTDSSAPYSVDWDTEPLADGDYELRVVTTDEAENSFASAPRPVSVDNHPPTVSIVAPTGYVNAGSADPFTISATSPDADIEGIELFRCSDESVDCDTGTWISLGVEDTAPYSASWPIDPDGNRALRAVATDGASNTGEDVVNVTIDRLAPTGSLTAPADAAQVTGSVTVSSDSADSGSGVDSAAFERRPAGGGPWVSIGSDSDAPFSVDWDTSDAADGDWDLRVVTTDAAGNDHASAARTVTVDNSAPSDPIVSLDESSPFAHASGTTVYVNPGGSGSYDVSATSADAHSGIGKIRFPGPVDVETPPYEATYDLGDLDGPQSVTAFNGVGLTASSAFTVTEDADAPTGGSVSYTDGYDEDGEIEITVGAGSDALSGLDLSTAVLERRTSDLADDDCAPFAGGWSTVTSPDTVTSGLCAQYRYRVADNVGNEAVSTDGSVVKVDLDAPGAPVLTLDESSPWAHVTGTEIFLNTAETGLYQVRAAAADPHSGVARVSFPGGNDDTTEPYDQAYAFGDLAPGTHTVTAHDLAGNTSASDFDVTEDLDAPAGGSVAYAGGYDEDGVIEITVEGGSDALSGLDLSSAVLERRTSDLADDGCAPFAGGWDTVTSPDTVASGLCAQYRYRVSDNVGNEAAYTSAAVVKVDLDSPDAPALSLDESSPWAHASGTTVYVNPGQSGSYDVAATSTDPHSGIAKIRFPGPLDDSTPPYQTSYDLADLDGAQTVTAFDRAGNTASSDFTVTPDADAPTGGSIAYTAGYDDDGEIEITTDAGTDPLSGLDPTSALLERRTSDLADNDCAPFTGPWDTVTSPDTLPSGLCAQYRYRIADNVGNEATHTSPAVAKVDLDPPTAPNLTLDESSPHAHVSGTEIFLNTAQTGTYDLTATSTDPHSGIAKITFPHTGDDTTPPYQTTYQFHDLTPGTHTVTAHNRANNTNTTNFDVTEDTTAPSTTDDTGAVGSDWKTAPVTVTLVPTDGGAGVAATYYTTDGSAPTTGSSEGTSVELTEDGIYTIRYFSVDRVGNAEPVQTAGTAIRIDGTSPDAPAISLDESSPYAHVDGGEIFVDPGETGTYTVSAVSADATSGLDRISFPGGVDDTTSPYAVIYALGDLAGVQTVTAFDAAGNSESDTFAVTHDTDAPTGGSVSYPDGWDDDGEVTVATEDGADALSGIDPASRVLERRTAPLSGGLCDPFAGGWSPVASPDSVSDGTCAQYRYRVSDYVGNEAVSASANVVRVDLGPPQTAIDAAPSDPSSESSPAFEFSADEAGSTFECRLDGDAWTPCTSPETVGPLDDGPHTFRVRATDGAGNTDPTPAQHDWTVDTVAPDSAIDAAPADPSSDDLPAFSFSADEAGSTFECRLDGDAWTPCTSPETVGPLDDGPHTFRVRATDAAGNTDPTPAQHDWTVDTEAPETSFTLVPSDPSNDPEPAFEFESTEAGSTFECRLDGDAWTPCTSPETVGPLDDGPHTFRVRATDPAGNADSTPAEHSWNVNAAPPEIAIVQPAGFVNAADSDPYTVRAASPDGDIVSVELFRCSDDSGGCADGTWVSLGTDATAPFEASWPLDGDGNRALRAVAVDIGANTGEDVVDVTIDRTVPDTTVDDAPTDPSSSSAASFEFSSNEAGAAFECRLDGGAWTSCTSPAGYAGLGEGAHTFAVRANDAAGNVDATPATHAWTVDTVPPESTIDLAPADPSADASPAFEFSSSEPGSSFECRLDGGAWTPCTSPHVLGGLADGGHTFSVRAFDAAGNVDPTPASHTWTVDATPPDGGIADPGELLRGVVNLSASANEDGDGIQSVEFQYSPADAGTWTSIDVDTTEPYGAIWDTTEVGDGLYDLRAVITDGVGNSAPTAPVEDRLVDNTAPGATMNDPGAYLRATVELTSATSDAGSGVASVAYERSPADAGDWTAVPASWDTTGVADGLYDLRVVVTDNAGNAGVSAPVSGRRVDNTKPGLASSAPADGLTLATAGSLVVVASEDLAGIAGAELDGAPAPAPTVGGDTVTFATAFANGPHTLTGELEDLAGNRQPIRVHFTVWSGAGVDYPFVEKNAFPGVATSLRSASDTATVVVPAGAWSGAPAGDWLVVRIDPQPAGAVANGFQAASEIFDVTAYWALAGTSVTTFALPLRIEIDNALSQVIPATYEDGAWRALPAVPAGGDLPASWADGFRRDGADVHVLTRHLSFFTLLRDVQAPTTPGGFKGVVKGRKLSLSWTSSSDNSGLIASYRVYRNGAVVKTLPGSARSVGMGAFKPSDARSYQVAAVDEAGNVGKKTYVLKAVPRLAKLPLPAAKKALGKRGFKVGKVTTKRSASVPKGRVVAAGQSGLRRSGTKIALVVSSGRGGSARPAPAAPAPPASPPASPPPQPAPPAGAPAPAPAAGPAAAPPAETTPVSPSGAFRGPSPIPDTALSRPALGLSALRHELGFGILAAAFSVTLLAGLRRRRPHLAADPSAEELLWDVRALQSAGRALRRLFGGV